MLRTRICDLLGIEYPIIQAPMNWITGANLAAAVSNAGGLGTLGPNAGATEVTEDVALTGERLRSEIRKLKTLTQKPFAVNFPIGFGTVKDFADRCVEVSLEEDIHVAITSMGSPKVYTSRFREAGVKVFHLVTSVRYALKAEEAGVDAVVAQGFEAGGHSGADELPTMVLVPQVVDAVKIPVIAAGGIADARGVVAALALGAEAVYMGTRFLATLECDAHSNLKQAVVDANDTSTIAWGKKLGVGIGRSLKNEFIEKYIELETGGAPLEELGNHVLYHPMRNALVQGDIDTSEAPCGANAGMIHDIMSAREVIENIVAEVPAILAKLNEKQV
ncbi:MAG TPA: enoyl-[acyl-carrier-protein] reductase FabK [Dehalococcoidia bacterium]|nr:enoyl-[acyl-carrier-protein] reductase FabK [Dehalococcoidia bacterium]